MQINRGSYSWDCLLHAAAAAAAAVAAADGVVVFRVACLVGKGHPRYIDIVVDCENKTLRLTKT